MYFPADLFALIDWQTALAGIAVEDLLGRMLVSSCHTELREKHTDKVIKRFFE